MPDYLLELSKNPAARNAVKKLNLPLPLPENLKRITGPWPEQPLADLVVDVGHLPKSALAPFLAKALCSAGATVYASGSDSQFAHYQDSATAWGRIAKIVEADAKPTGYKAHALVFDVTGAQGPEDLKAMYAFYNARLRSLASSGRVLICARPFGNAKDLGAAVASRAVEGFMRSVGKEIGKKGATATLLYVDEGAEERLIPVARFFLSHASAYVSGQPVHISGAVAAPKGYSNTRSLDGKTALVTGAAQGIGRQIAIRLALEGARVICMDRPAEEKATAELARQIKGSALHLDITDKDAAKVMADHVAKHGKKLDALIHNAGVTRDKMLVNMDEQRWDMAMTINLMAVMETTDSLLPLMPTDARIVCLSSIAGIAGNPGQTNYAASKAGIIGMVKALAPSFAKKGICINAVAPGFIETRMTAAIPLTTREAGRRLCSLGQGGLPEDVAQVVTFLSTPQASGITGEAIRICGQNFIGA
ncbi:MAG: 3-oxoacyl-ACP reductase [Desulfatibacillaceae bacterium]|nr:3-oxoacyl-ACP reductase [Desulfatibacillaceae bacterium]